MKRIEIKIEEVMSTLRQLKYESKYISPEEFYDYMTGKMPTGDAITFGGCLE